MCWTAKKPRQTANLATAAFGEVIEAASTATGVVIATAADVFGSTTEGDPVWRAAATCVLCSATVRGHHAVATVATPVVVTRAGTGAPSAAVTLGAALATAARSGSVILGAHAVVIALAAVVNLANHVFSVVTTPAKHAAVDFASRGGEIPEEHAELAKHAGVTGFSPPGDFPARFVVAAAAANPNTRRCHNHSTQRQRASQQQWYNWGQQQTHFQQQLSLRRAQQNFE